VWRAQFLGARRLDRGNPTSGNIGAARLAPVRLHLVTIRRWRPICTALAGSFDQVMSRYLGAVAGANPW